MSQSFNERLRALPRGSSFEARLIKYNELLDNLGYANANNAVSNWDVNEDYTPSWVYNSSYNYWTMSPYTDSSFNMCFISSYGKIFYNYGSSQGNVYRYYDTAVRPVIVLPKSALN